MVYVYGVCIELAVPCRRPDRRGFVRSRTAVGLGVSSSSHPQLTMVSKSDRRRVSRSRRHAGGSSEPRKPVFNRLLENRLIGQVSFEEYREKVRDVYDGPQGALLATCSLLSLHTSMGARLFRERKFDLRGARRILDVGSGAGQIAKHLIKYADPAADITCFDLSHEMLRRARNRLKSDRPRFVVADLTRLPFADGSFDCVTCGYVLEHLPDARVGLAELSRVMLPGADAAADDRGQFRRRLDEPSLVLPHV